MSLLSSRKHLKKAVTYGFAILGLGFVFVSLDFLIDFTPASIQASYRFELDELVVDQPQILRQDNLWVLVIKRSPGMSESLKQRLDNLQDAKSKNSRQPEFAKRLLRSFDSNYFVSYALGTYMGCPLVVKGLLLSEVCSDASYDFAGRALKGDKKFQNLSIPDYNFSHNFKVLTIRP